MGQGATKLPEVQADAAGFSLHCRVEVPVPPALAFEAFTGRLADWWVREYTWSGPDALADIGIEPRPDGMAFEIGPHGFRTDWGRVLVWDPPHRLLMTWQIGPDRAPVPDPEQASEIDVRFVADNGTHTLVELDHRAFDRHGDAAAGYLQALTAGWQELLGRYAEMLRAAG
ncbi:SRPBCC family protein [Plantactinospora sp. KBS50]|uniref:SRPBCC family protein n=1 Tax=Plantactinospora sp. KBS50 TaxID=2024580 RepID=UPI000BAB0BEC|nr:SRPBCC family protein [Plantactinospora sp. KBS50]ASW53087.1 ATPase [Plantactinospora sp. KBS50]